METISVDEYKLAIANGAVFENKPRKKYKHEEDDLTIKTANYLDDLKFTGKILMFTHISNETFTKYHSVKVKNRQKGVRPGIPDMFIVFNHGVLFLELKREKHGVVSPDQKKWLEAIVRAGGDSGKIGGEVTAGWAKTKEIIDKYVKLMS